VDERESFSDAGIRPLDFHQAENREIDRNHESDFYRFDSANVDVWNFNHLHFRRTGDSHVTSPSVDTKSVM